MAKECAICGKKPIVRNQLVQTGKPKREGGVGRRTTGISKTWKHPNLQRVKVLQSNGQRQTMRVCTQCIRSGKTIMV